MSHGNTKLLEKLHILIKNSILTLVLPEIVSLEIEKQMSSLSDDLKKHHDSLRTAITGVRVWNEIDDIKQSILVELESLINIKKEKWEVVYKVVQEILNSINLLPYNPEIMCNAKKRLMRGGMPQKTSSRSDQDAAIIESLKSYFSQINEDSTLFFCSENHNDFAIEIDNAKSINRAFAIHPCLTDSLPKTFYFTALEDLLGLKLDPGYETLPKLPDGKEVNDAMARLEKLENEDNDEFDAEKILVWEQLNGLIHNSIVNRFATEINPILPDEIRTLRAELINTIQSLLKQCRQTKLWSNSSELKLNQWLEYVPENMISYTTLSNLLNIKNNLERYYRIHTEINPN